MSESVNAYNMRALNLRNYELQMHYYLMKGSMKEWPESLQDYVRAKCAELGMCGEVIAQAVADWIRKEPTNNG